MQQTPGLEGPFSLDRDAIDAAVTTKCPGTYALGRPEGEAFRVSYIGRSDSDLAASLKQHVGSYSQFKFICCGSPREAFENECLLYHNLGNARLDNRLHPVRPAGGGWQCPGCKVFDY